MRFAELLIAADPFGQPHTVLEELGGRTVSITDFGDLTIYYEVRDPETVALYMVIDAKHVPDWFTGPTGTWFEDIDLE